ncbi:MAG: hydantoinase B/oxoprolinase family protein [Desulfurococcales archaeon]|jgi:N-methylhydantoinase B|nr:hydantoinase B/oxoprolinase family protein [Desulfurococcales archaeon]
MPSWELIYKATVYIAEEMGVALKRSAFSPNIRERMDHSCAIVDKKGRIVAQAEHIPVHLGSFRVCVRNIIGWIENSGEDLGEGDMLIFNDPYISGTHLNDVTVIAPIYRGGIHIGYVINKAHQVDVGGPMPGSMNPIARTIYEEGLIIPPIKVVKKGSVDKEVMRIITANTKTPLVTEGDTKAQIAANIVGSRRVAELVERYGLEAVEDAWEKAISHGRALAMSKISGWRRGVFEAEDYLELEDQDPVIRVKLEIGEDVRVDFTGTSKQVDKPYNAVYGVTYAAVVYPIRSLIEGDIPVNEGFYSIVEVSAPEGTIVNPRKPAPVSGGNVETSQRVADTVLKALSTAIPERVPAAGSGTMMNVMIGGEDPSTGYWAYYETIGGGSGGRPGKHGVSGVHVNMTNTMNTPIEVAERVYPVLYTAYRIREDSGGRGRYRGGDGIIRSFRVLRPARLSIMAERIKRAPWGLNGGEPGKPGRIVIRKRDGRELIMPSKFTIDLDEGDEVIIETPGGGGWGSISAITSQALRMF